MGEELVLWLLVSSTHLEVITSIIPLCTKNTYWTKYSMVLQIDVDLIWETNKIVAPSTKLSITVKADFDNSFHYDAEQTVSLTCGQRENVLFIGTYTIIYWVMVLCSMLSWWWDSMTPPSHHIQEVLLSISEVQHSTPFLLHWCPIFCCWGSQHLPLQGGGAQCVNTVVVAVILTTPTTEIVQFIADSNTGKAPYSQWRCSTSGTLLPATSVHVKRLHTGEKLTLLSAIVHLGHFFLVSTPQIELIVNNSWAVFPTTSGFPPSIHCEE